MTIPRIVTFFKEDRLVSNIIKCVKDFKLVMCTSVLNCLCYCYTK